ncbi:hypothetical protein [Pedobacter jeongneungensis]|uniref:hypothetical protein n=1 Tax=Pedobacter jeongneungensis TaxID=947309 RepID=UPI00046A5EA4|nr:hypothetical protein [Pedobacter jeongneungensis]
MDNNSSSFKNISLLEEIETANRLIRLGFGEIQNIDFVNNFYFLPFQLLSQGFERLMKSYICLGYYNKNGKYPDFQYIKDLGHDLEALLRRILLEFFNDHQRYYLIEDRRFLEKDGDLKELIYILSEFGKFARYHNFDVITGKVKPSVNPKELWEVFEVKIINQLGISKYKNRDLEDEMFGDIARVVIIIFEKFVSALARQFNFGTLGDHARGFSANVFDFAMLYPDKVGTTDYRKDTTRFKQQPRRVHKRTLMDLLNRRFNPNIKSKKIRKVDFERQWPFYAEEVIVEKRRNYWLIVSISGYDYALNGAAKGKFKLDDPFEAGEAIRGITISDFIDIGLSL